MTQERCLKNSKDIRERKLCTKWIVQACSEYGFRTCVTGAAAAYFDRVMSYARSLPELSNITFKESIVAFAARRIDPLRHTESAVCELICIVCISIAAKKLEPKAKAPFLGDFEDFYSFKELQKMENLVLEALKWDLSSVTAIDFFHHWQPHMSSGHQKTLQEVCEKCVLRSIGETWYSESQPSLAGAAVTVWGHAALRLDVEMWQQRLMAHADLDLDEVLRVVGFMSQLLSKEYPDAYVPSRSCSPVSVMEITTEFHGNKTMVQPGVKRPTPKRVGTSDGKKRKVDATML